MRAVVIGALARGAVTACGSSGSGSPASSPSGSTATTISTGSTPIGTVLTDRSGLTLYYLTTEQGGHDACTSMAGCSSAWPAVKPPASGSPVGSSAVTGALTVITAADGSQEVAYNGWPLHTFQGDANTPGLANGNRIMSFGGTWYVATPALTTSGGASAGQPAQSPRSRY